MAAWASIWDLVKLLDSFAKSASKIWLFEASVLTTTFVKFETAWSNLLEIAPCSALDRSIILNAPSIIAIAFSELATVPKSTSPTFKNVDESAVVPPSKKLSVSLVPALAVAENDLTESNCTFPTNVACVLSAAKKPTLQQLLSVHLL